MMNDYIEIPMTSIPNNQGGSFVALASFRLDNIISPFRNVPVKIDTGCSNSTIPLARFKTLESFCDTLKTADLLSGARYEISYGIESGGEKHKKPIDYNEKMECKALKFQHKVSDFMLANMPIDIGEIFVNYNRKGNILIGMDILRNWDIHMGLSKVTGVNMFLACPKGYENKKYFDALEYHFGISF